VDRQPERAPARREPTRLAFHASRIIIDAGVLIALGAMSLPFVEGPGRTVSSIDADALPALLLLIPIFLITLIPDHTRPVPNPLGWLALVLGVAAFPYSIVKFLDSSTIAETIGGSVGLGARLLVFGTFATVLGIAVGLARNMLRLPTGGTYPASRPLPTITRSQPAASRPSRAKDPEPAPSRSADDEARSEPASPRRDETRSPEAKPARPPATETTRRSGRAAAERARRAEAADPAPERPGTSPEEQ
jgi:hypothetical protein